MRADRPRRRGIEALQVVMITAIAAVILLLFKSTIQIIFWLLIKALSRLLGRN